MRADFLAEEAVVLDHFDGCAGPALGTSRAVVIDVGEELFDIPLTDNPRAIVELPYGPEICLRPKPVVT